MSNNIDLVLMTNALRRVILIFKYVLTKLIVNVEKFIEPINEFNLDLKSKTTLEYFSIDLLNNISST